MRTNGTVMGRDTWGWGHKAVPIQLSNQFFSSLRQQPTSVVSNSLAFLTSRSLATQLGRRYQVFFSQCTHKWHDAFLRHHDLQFVFEGHFVFMLRYKFK